MGHRSPWLPSTKPGPTRRMGPSMRTHTSRSATWATVIIASPASYIRAHGGLASSNAAGPRPTGVTVPSSGSEAMYAARVGLDRRCALHAAPRTSAAPRISDVHAPARTHRRVERTGRRAEAPSVAARAAAHAQRRGQERCRHDARVVVSELERAVAAMDEGVSEDQQGARADDRAEERKRQGRREPPAGTRPDRHRDDRHGNDDGHAHEREGLYQDGVVEERAVREVSPGANQDPCHERAEREQAEHASAGAGAVTPALERHDHEIGRVGEPEGAELHGDSVARLAYNPSMNVVITGDFRLGRCTPVHAPPRLPCRTHGAPRCEARFRSSCARP